jgi:glutamate N-acetyltransferase/amino-acid N-acetyltransferase
VKLPKSFYADGVHCGIAKNKKKKDIAIFYSGRDCAAAGIFTRNLVKAAPVLVSRANLAKSAGAIRAIVANSGCANACTGEKGMSHVYATTGFVGARLGINDFNVLVASTGVIGVELPVLKVEDGVKRLSAMVMAGKSSPNAAVEAIMTTDTFQKQACREVVIGGKRARIWGCAKGAGMIHPDMATLLSFVLTDAAITPGVLKTALKPAADVSFNRVTVDGDTSTNDSLIALANGAAGNKKITAPSGADYRKFAAALSSVCRDLAVMVAADGEGATKLIRVYVGSARSAADAKKAAAAVATSPLVKTAAFGNDPNWGRVIAAAGRSGAEFDPGRVDISINGTTVARNGEAVPFSESALKRSMTRKELKINIELNSGNASAEYYTCDFSFDYVKINASYRT